MLWGGMEQLTSFEAPQPIKLTVDDFAVLHDAGAFVNHKRAELIDGVIVCMSPQTSLHVLVANRLARRLGIALDTIGSPLEALVAPTVAIPPHNAPEPDVALLLTTSGQRYFPLESMALAIEVSRTTLRYDLTTKRDLYARAAVPEYWVVDVEGERVHRFQSPRDGAYLPMLPIPLAGELRSLTMPELAIDGTGIL